jgi:8-oxo-dGTP diphosphatase
LEIFSTFVPVVAAALIDGSDRILVQRRRLDSAHGGLWEFPGGKIEPGESPESALLREIEEELGVTLDAEALTPLTFASDPALPPAPRAPHVILLYTCRRWRGEPRCHVGEEIGWFAPADLPGLAMPPLDYPLARALIRSFGESR